MTYLEENLVKLDIHMDFHTGILYKWIDGKKMVIDQPTDAIQQLASMPEPPVVTFTDFDNNPPALMPYGGLFKVPYMLIFRGKIYGPNNCIAIAKGEIYDWQTGEVLAPMQYCKEMEMYTFYNICRIEEINGVKVKCDGVWYTLRFDTKKPILSVELNDDPFYKLIVNEDGRRKLALFGFNIENIPIIAVNPDTYM